MQLRYQYHVERRIGPRGMNVMEVMLFITDRHGRRVPGEMIRVQILSKDGSPGLAVTDARKLLGHAVLGEWLPSDVDATEEKNYHYMNDKS